MSGPAWQPQNSPADQKLTPNLVTPRPLWTILRAMAAAAQADLGTQCRAILRDLSKLWAFAGLAETVEVQVSARLTRALARVAMDKRVVRLAEAVATGPATALREVLTHEAAHVVVHARHGRKARPHGREWAELMRKADYTPRARVAAQELGLTMPKPRRRNERYVYEHRCPVCHGRKLAGRPVRQWRCMICLGVGLSGELEVRRWTEITGKLARTAAAGRRG